MSIAILIALIGCTAAVKFTGYIKGKDPTTALCDGQEGIGGRQFTKLAEVNFVTYLRSNKNSVAAPYSLVTKTGVYFVGSPTDFLSAYFVSNGTTTPGVYTSLEGVYFYYQVKIGSNAESATFSPPQYGAFRMPAGMSMVLQGNAFFFGPAPLISFPIYYVTDSCLTGFYCQPERDLNEICTVDSIEAEGLINYGKTQAALNLDGANLNNTRKKRSVGPNSYHRYELRHKRDAAADLNGVANLFDSILPWNGIGKALSGGFGDILGGLLGRRKRRGLNDEKVFKVETELHFDDAQSTDEVVSGGSTGVLTTEFCTVNLHHKDGEYHINADTDLVTVDGNSLLMYDAEKAQLFMTDIDCCFNNDLGSHLTSCTPCDGEPIAVSQSDVAEIKELIDEFEEMTKDEMSPIVLERFERNLANSIVEEVMSEDSEDEHQDDIKDMTWDAVNSAIAIGSLLLGVFNILCNYKKWACCESCRIA